jgi:hypothetical protein
MDQVRDLEAAGGVSVVLAQDRDRLAREPAYHYIPRQEFEENGKDPGAGIPTPPASGAGTHPYSGAPPSREEAPGTTLGVAGPTPLWMWGIDGNPHHRS